MDADNVIIVTLKFLGPTVAPSSALKLMARQLPLLGRMLLEAFPVLHGVSG